MLEVSSSEQPSLLLLLVYTLREKSSPPIRTSEEVSPERRFGRNSKVLMTTHTWLCSETKHGEEVRRGHAESGQRSVVSCGRRLVNAVVREAGRLWAVVGDRWPVVSSGGHWVMRGAEAGCLAQGSTAVPVRVPKAFGIDAHKGRCYCHHAEVGRSGGPLLPSPKCFVSAHNRWVRAEAPGDPGPAVNTSAQADGPSRIGSD